MNDIGLAVAATLVFSLLALAGFVALLALVGWGGTLVMLARSQLPQANALAQLLRVNTAIDDRIKDVVKSVREIENRPSGAPRPRIASPQDNMRAQVEQIFGGVSPIDEQPPAEGMEALEL